MTDHRFSCVLFDLDGTLVDTAPDLTGALNHVLATYDLDPFTVEKVRNTVGFGARITIERSLSHYGKVLSDEEMDLAHAQFLAHYSDNICKSSTLFPRSKRGYWRHSRTTIFGWLSAPTKQSIFRSTCLVKLASRAISPRSVALIRCLTKSLIPITYIRQLTARAASAKKPSS